jgi:hypothetical protein
VGLLKKYLTCCHCPVTFSNDFPKQVPKKDELYWTDSSLSLKNNVISWFDECGPS